MVDTNRSETPVPTSIIGQLLKFASCGGVSALTDIGTYSLLVRLASVNPLIANPFSRSLGGLVSFLLNRHWTFSQTRSGRLHKHFFKYWLVWLFAMGLSESMIWVFFEVLGAGPIIAKLLAEGITGLVVFFVHRHWTFR